MRSNVGREPTVADDLTNALHHAGIHTLAVERDYKEAPGDPVVEVMLTRADAAKLARILERSNDEQDA